MSERASVAWRSVFLALVFFGASCSTGTGVQEVPDPDLTADVGDSDQGPEDGGPAFDSLPPADTVEPVDQADPDLPPVDAAQQQCDPGEGCFLDPCEENDDCDSGWCVGHMGEDVCTLQCQTECPPGWSCQQVPGTAPDVIWLCVSAYANLCLPCATAADCKGAAGVDDACLDYGDEGSFCGGGCTTDADCPWGFSCADANTVDGVELQQCVADAGVCPCTGKSVELGLTTPCEVSNAFGVCGGLRACTEEGLTGCDAAVPAAELCNGLDDDCDGEIDEPNIVDGGYQDLCDDGNDCTEDGCDGAAGCTHAALSEGECVDGDVCTVGDHCEAGVCLGSPVACDDGNPCTDDLCDGLGGCEFVANSAGCDDGDPCTVADGCDETVCAGVAVSCDCQADGDCAALEDGDLCNGTLVCDTGALPFQCAVDPATVVGCPGPPAGPDQICLAAACDPATGACGLLPANEGFLCDDGDPCTVGEVCAAGACAGGVAPNCNDGNLCTDDTCEAGLGCAHVPNAASCNDGDVCTVADICDGGECAGGAALECVDGDPCTADSCDPLLGCQFAPLEGGACDDANACTTGDHCVQGQCVYDGLADCDDGDPCTTDACNPATGCIHTLNAAPCDDGDACTTGDVCQAGECVGAGQLNCDDGNPCTDDSCIPGGGCLHQANDGDCSDGNACTTADHCTEGACVPGELLACDDGDVCTTDTCDPATGCVATLNNAPCDDGDLCTIGDVCNLGSCLGTGLLPCDDGNLCTDDSCDPQLGCQFAPNMDPCDDGEPCTDGDACAAGWCHPGGPKSCDDGNVCSADSCVPGVGCQAVLLPDGTPCLDGGVEKICVLGDCVCEPDCDGKECGDDGCGGTCGSCADDDACTLDETCDAGLCVSTPLVCTDEDPCTDAACDPVLGCVFPFNTAPCDDGDPCTANDVCSGGACVGVGIPQLDPFSFSTGGATGRLGPTQGQLDVAYAGTNLAGDVTSSGGIQAWTVPYTGTYTITAAGAKGGDGGANNPGKGAVLSGDFDLEAGTTLYVIVGQMGLLSKQTCCWTYGASGGGGASWVYTDPLAAVPLMAAAGGGGHAENATAGHGSGATTPTMGSGGSGASGAGGSNGSGGAHGPTPYDYTPGAGGAGWASNGQTAPTIRNPGGIGGEAPRNGGEGGYGVHDSYGPEHASGGFGGGGAGSDNTGAGGGGGGYNGGGGGRNYNGGGNWGAAGGGGSYNGGTNPTAQTGQNDGPGSVTITFECN